MELGTAPRGVQRLAGSMLLQAMKDLQSGTRTQQTSAFEWLEARFNECAARGEVVHLQIARDAATWKGPVTG